MFSKLAAVVVVVLSFGLLATAEEPPDGCNMYCCKSVTSNDNPVVDHPAFGHAGSIVALAAEKGDSDALRCIPYDPNEDDCGAGTLQCCEYNLADGTFNTGCTPG